MDIEKMEKINAYIVPHGFKKDSAEFVADNGKFGDERIEIYRLSNGDHLATGNGDPTWEATNPEFFWECLDEMGISLPKTKREAQNGNS